MKRRRSRVWACDARQKSDSIAAEVGLETGGRYPGHVTVQRGLGELVSRRPMAKDGDWCPNRVNDLRILSRCRSGGLVPVHIGRAVRSLLTLGSADAERARDGGSGKACSVSEPVFDSGCKLEDLENDDFTRS